MYEILYKCNTFFDTKKIAFVFAEKKSCPRWLYQVWAAEKPIAIAQNFSDEEKINGTKLL